MLRKNNAPLKEPRIEKTEEGEGRKKRRQRSFLYVLEQVRG